MKKHIVLKLIDLDIESMFTIQVMGCSETLPDPAEGARSRHICGAPPIPNHLQRGDGKVPYPSPAPANIWI
jgi:hypothetical protein